MPEKQSYASFKPADFVEGGAVPVDKNLRWEDVRFILFDYMKKTGEKVATTVAACVNYKDDEGKEYIQNYSAADPERFQPSEDGKSLVPVVPGTALTKSSNFFMLIDALVNAGFPENRLGEDISVLNGLYTFNIGIPEPTRAGLARAADPNARPKVISVPSKILQLPWEKKGAKGVAKSAPAAGGGDVMADAVAAAKKLLEKSDSVTRQQVATACIRDKKPLVAKAIFGDAAAEALIAEGLVLDGDTITKVS